MSNLLSLELHGNGLSGELPPEMFDADKLQLLNVALQYGYSSECVMSNGTVVNTYFQRGGTMGARVNYGLEGRVLGPDVSRWSSMKGLHLFDNSFAGGINETIGDLKYLGEFDFSKCVVFFLLYLPPGSSDKPLPPPCRHARSVPPSAEQPILRANSHRGKAPQEAPRAFP